MVAILTQPHCVDMEMLSTLQIETNCEGIYHSLVDCPHRGPVMQRLNVLLVDSLNKMLTH